jgi:hypothetical protein
LNLSKFKDRISLKLNSYVLLLSAHGETQHLREAESVCIRFAAVSTEKYLPTFWKM